MDKCIPPNTLTPLSSERARARAKLFEVCHESMEVVIRRIFTALKTAERL
jgi:hypothetical protein